MGVCEVTGSTDGTTVAVEKFVRGRVLQNTDVSWKLSSKGAMSSPSRKSYLPHGRVEKGLGATWLR